MHDRVRAEWAKALRSGEYKQTMGTLKDDKGFCCLGVLCDLHAKETGNVWTTTHVSSRGYGYGHGNGTSTPPLEVREWAGLNESLGPLAAMNDRGRSFTEIANFIENNLR